MRSFTILWLGQIVSLIGSAMTWFAFTIWAWEATGKASALATISFFAFLPTVLFSPVAGAFVDRWNRKLVMLLSDLATAVGTLLRYPRGCFTSSTLGRLRAKGRSTRRLAASTISWIWGSRMSSLCR